MFFCRLVLELLVNRSFFFNLVCLGSFCVSFVLLFKGLLFSFLVFIVCLLLFGYFVVGWYVVRRWVVEEIEEVKL